MGKIGVLMVLGGSGIIVGVRKFMRCATWHACIGLCKPKLICINLKGFNKGEWNSV